MQFIIDHIVEMTKIVTKSSYTKHNELSVDDWYKAEIAGPTVVVNQIYWTLDTEKAFD